MKTQFSHLHILPSSSSCLWTWLSGEQLRVECRDLEYHSIRDRVYVAVSGYFHLVCCIHMLLYEGRAQMFIWGDWGPSWRGGDLKLERAERSLRLDCPLKKVIFSLLSPLRSVFLFLFIPIVVLILRTNLGYHDRPRANRGVVFKIVSLCSSKELSTAKKRWNLWIWSVPPSHRPSSLSASSVHTF